MHITVKPPNRRFLLRQAALFSAFGPLTLALSNEAQAKKGGGSKDKPPPNHIRLTPISLPGKDRLSYVKLEIELVVQQSEKTQADVDLVNAYKMRILGRLNEQLSQHRFTSLDVSAKEVGELKARIRNIANTAIGKPIIEEALIVSLILT